MDYYNTLPQKPFPPLLFLYITFFSVIYKLDFIPIGGENDYIHRLNSKSGDGTWTGRTRQTLITRAKYPVFKDFCALSFHLTAFLEDRVRMKMTAIRLYSIEMLIRSRAFTAKRFPSLIKLMTKKPSTQANPEP